MKLPCTDCAFKTERQAGHRIFVGCQDPERKKKHFIEDDFLYWYECTGYVKESKPESQ